MASEQEKRTHIALFEEQTVRRVWHEDEQQWYYSIIDVVAVLTKSKRPRKYWSDLKTKLLAEGFDELSAKIGQLKLASSDGKKYLTDVVDTPTLLRIIQSIPSPRAEPFKRWLAALGNERLQEIESPELALDRIRKTYEAKGYTADWIELRLQSIVVRNELTQEWKERGARGERDYAILTNDIAQATFGIGVQPHKEVKGLKRENLRDHFTTLEQVLMTLGEATTTALHRERDSQGFPELQGDALEGGAVAGQTRQDIERRLGAPVVSSENYLSLKGKKKQMLSAQQHVLEGEASSLEENAPEDSL